MARMDGGTAWPSSPDPVGLSRSSQLALTSANNLLSARKDLITSVVNPQKSQTMRTAARSHRPSGYSVIRLAT
jgi:hypothetical protein